MSPWVGRVRISTAAVLLHAYPAVTADGAQLGSRPTLGCVRLLFAFFTGSSDLGWHRISILQGPKAVFLCSFLVTAGLQDKRAPFEPRGGPKSGKDKNQAGQMGPNPHPLWHRAPLVLVLEKSRDNFPCE